MPDVILYQDQPVTRSLDVARRFHKRHDHVLRLIDNIFASVGVATQNCVLDRTPPDPVSRPQNWGLDRTPPEPGSRAQNWALDPGSSAGELTEFFRGNFLAGEYIRQTGKGARRAEPMYYLTRDGFSYLVMGFTGKEAALWKVRFIKLFNLMEAELREQARVPERRAFLAGKLYAHALRWTPERRKLVGRVLLFREAGHTYKRIAEDTGISPSAVGNIVRRYFYEDASFDWDEMERMEKREMERRRRRQEARGFCRRVLP